MGKERRSPDSVIGGDGDDGDRMVIVFGINPIAPEARISSSIDTRFRRHLVSGVIGRKSGKSQGYAVLEFDSELAADKFRQEYGCREFWWTAQPLQVRWASCKQLQLLENQEGKKGESNCNGKLEKPIWVLNYPGENYDGNRMLRVDGLEPWFMSFDLKMSIPWAFRRHVLDCYPVQYPNKFKTDGYGFIQFSSHDSAQRFLEKYNGSLIPGTNMHFQLSWAPFSDPGDHDKVFNDEDDELDEPGESDNEALAGQKNEQPDPLRSEEIMDPPYSTINKSDVEEVNVMEFLSRVNYLIISPLAVEKAEEKCPTRPTTLPDVIPSASQGDGDDAKILFANAVNPDSEKKLEQMFKDIGTCSVNIQSGKGCGTVLYESSDLAKKAMEKLQVSLLNEKMCSLSWGKSRSIQPIQDIYYSYPDCRKYCCNYSCNPLRCLSLGVPFRPYSLDPFVAQSFFSDGNCDICGKFDLEDKGVVAMTAEPTKVDTEKFEKMNEDYFQKVRLGMGFVTGSHRDLSSI